MLILTDGQPADVDVGDDRLLIEDARRAVRELDEKGIFTYCINLETAVGDGEWFDTPCCARLLTTNGPSPIW